MRLLERNSAGQVSLTKIFVGDNIPQYAILSHTWGADSDEVSHGDLINGIGKTKPGYTKIRYCAEWAKRDGLQYFWVDTCCIDKSNAVELQEAINSMFRWYQNAAKCYVYLSDVLQKKRRASDQSSKYTWELAFRSSRWFTRGWTLQELLAPGPDKIEFFSREGHLLGDKKALEQLIHEITRIPIEALRGNPLCQFDVSQRLLWAKNRQTTHEEDQAYSLFGIFDIQIPLLYGEGKEKALKRLQEEIDKPLKGIDRLPTATDAPFNSYSKQHEPTCLPDTRVDLLQQIYEWADGQNEQCIFWLNGLAGTGKSTIARTVASSYFDQKRLGASFFFSRGGGDVSHAGKFFTSFAVQLAQNIPQTQQFISDAVAKQNDIGNQSLSEQWRKLVLHPLSMLDSSSCPTSYVLVVDALDECAGEDDIGTILQLLAEARSLKTIQLRVFLTSRPEILIRHGFDQIPNTRRRDFVLHNISLSIVNHDIRIFIQEELQAIAYERSLEASWPGEQILERLVNSASGLFIWAATACRFLRQGRKRQVIKNRLSSILQSNGSITEPEKHLNQIYTAVLRQSVPSEFSVQEADEFCSKLRYVLGSVVALLSPLSSHSLSMLRRISEEDIHETLEDLHAILDIPRRIPNDQTRPLRLHHPSFRDFLLDRDKCNDLHFWVDERQAHRTLVNDCIRLMSNSLKQDVCEQQVPGTFVADVEPGRIEKSLPPEVRYACLYWIQHLQKSDSQLHDNDEVHRFLQAHLLHWLEALSWIGRTSAGILAILSLEALFSDGQNANLRALVHDAKRFTLYNRFLIERTPLQLYCSALIFAPENSIIRRQFEESVPPWILRKPKMEANWNTLLQILEGHLNGATSAVFSPDGRQVASGSHDSTVRLWDASTGAALQILKGHLRVVWSVAFSPDGQQIISGSEDKTVRLWNAITGAGIGVFRGHPEGIYSVAFSPDGQQIISGSADETVRLWNVITGAVIRIFRGHSNGVRSVAFSPDGQQIISGSEDETVQLWSAVTGAKLQTLTGHMSSVNCVAFSPNGKQVVSGSHDEKAIIWDVDTGDALRVLEGRSLAVNCVIFSPDGKWIISGSDGKTIWVWDAVTGEPLTRLDGHSERVTSVAFSPDGKQIVSSSDDGRVHIWDAVIGSTLPAIDGHVGSIKSVAFSLDGKQFVSGSVDETIRLWDTQTGVALHTIMGHTHTVWSVGFSSDNKQVISGSGNKTICLWDAATGALLQTLIVPWNTAFSVAFSPNSKLIGAGSWNEVHLLDATTGAPLRILTGHSGMVSSVAFSLDSRQVISGSRDLTVRLWDVATGAMLQTFDGHQGMVLSVAFSLDRKQVISGSTDKTVRVWDTITGALLQTIQSHAYWVNAVAFAPDNSAANALNISKDWVVDGYKRILWLAPGYRATCGAVRGRTVILGHASGKISVFRFKEGPKFI